METQLPGLPPFLSWPGQRWQLSSVQLTEVLIWARPAPKPTVITGVCWTQPVSAVWQFHSLLHLGHLFDRFHTARERLQLSEEVLGFPDANGFFLWIVTQTQTFTWQANETLQTSLFPNTSKATTYDWLSCYTVTDSVDWRECNNQKVVLAGQDVIRPWIRVMRSLRFLKSRWGGHSTSKWKVRLTQRSLLSCPYWVDTQNPLRSSKVMKGSFGYLSRYFFRNPPSKSAMTPSMSTRTRNLLPEEDMLDKHLRWQ